MKNIIIFFLFFFVFLGVKAQSISVASFRSLDSDLTANTTGTMEQDQNGETAALIKVVTTQTGFSFDGGALGIVKTLQKPSEIWVYVPRGIKKITIFHPQLGILRDYFFPMSIHAARTYEMVLTTGTVQTIVQQTSNSQYLVLMVTPADAVVELNNEILPTSEGMAQKFVMLGTYEYRVQAPNYHTAAGIVEVNDPLNKKVVEIKLNPAFGWIEIPSNKSFDGAQVFIDNALAGTIPMKSKDLPSGEHNVKIVKPLYNPFSQTVVVRDNETTTVTPSLSANFSEVTITVDNDADIYINDEKKGSGTWTSKLASGIYQLEAKKDGHRSTMQNAEITSAQPKTHIQLSAPTPIYGSANITSTPTMADVYIDGRNVGQTPLFIPQILIGQHKAVIKRDGYVDYEYPLEVKESQTLAFNAELQTYAMVNIIPNPPSAIVYIDGYYIGKGVVWSKQLLGKHVIEVKDDLNNYYEYKEEVNIKKDKSVIEVFLNEKKRPEVTFYFDDKPYGDDYFMIIDGGKPISLYGKTCVVTLTSGKHEIVIKYKKETIIKQEISTSQWHKKFQVLFAYKTINTL